MEWHHPVKLLESLLEFNRDFELREEKEMDMPELKPGMLIIEINGSVSRIETFYDDGYIWVRDMNTDEAHAIDIGRIRNVYEHAWQCPEPLPYNERWKYPVPPSYKKRLEEEIKNERIDQLCGRRCDRSNNSVSFYILGLEKALELLAE